MNYSELVEAIEQGNQSKANRLFKEVVPRLNAFLRVQMNATHQEAQDCSQEAVLNALEFIKKGKLRYADSLFSFLLSSCRNNYYNMQKRKGKSSLTEVPKDETILPKQLHSMLSEERRALLEQCVEQLSESYRTFFEYWYQYPDSKAKAAASRFDMTESNVWTRKHRLIKKLNQCYQEKSEI